MTELLVIIEARARYLGFIFYFYFIYLKISIMNGESIIEHILVFVFV